MTQNRIYGFVDKKTLKFCNLTTQRKLKKKKKKKNDENLGICGSVRKYSIFASSEFKKEKKKRVKVKKNTKKD